VAVCSHTLLVSLPPHRSHLVRLALFDVVVSVAVVVAVPFVVSAVTRTLRTNIKILEAELEPAISSLGGRRLIH
jgi:ACR3 family arsenite efflux pump ArsB